MRCLARLVPMGDGAVSASKRPTECDGIEQRSMLVKASIVINLEWPEAMRVRKKITAGLLRPNVK
jgi:hypothetical protein